MALVATDITNPTEVERELAEANQLLAERLEVPAPVLDLVESLTAALADESDESFAAWDPYLVLALQRAALGAKLALDHDDPDRRRKLRIRLEQMRHVFRDFAAEAPVADERPVKEIARWLAATVNVPQQRLADLLGVDKRTLQRWISESQSSSPDGEDERRLRVVARLVNQLRHALTPIGVIGWFERERSELGGEPPLRLLGEPDGLPRLQALAAGARSSTGA